MTDQLFLEVAPESLGIPSSCIENLIDEFDKYGMYMHSFLLMRHGKVAAEGYYKPFHKDELHRAYSISKTFTGTAIGLLCDEGKLSLDDYVYKFFPDKISYELHEYVKEIRVRDLLMMSTPFSSTPYVDSDDWVKAFLYAEPNHPSGTIFSYHTLGTCVLAIIVERITGKPYLEYLKDKVLRDIGFSEDAWCIKSPEGNSWGGSGIICSTRDLARLGLLYMNGGMLGGRQYLSKEYVEAATTMQIDNNTVGHKGRYKYGYGYKIWVTRDGSFSFMGMGNQEVICIPDKDIIFVCTADNQGNEESSRTLIYELLWKNIVNKISDCALEENYEAYSSLKRKIQNLELHKIEGASHSKTEEKINRQNYILNKNNMNISKLRLEFLEEYGKLCYDTPRGKKEILFGYGEYKIGTFPENHYWGDTVNQPANREYRCAAMGVWTRENKLIIKVNIIDWYFGNLTINLGFKGDEVGVYMFKSAEKFLDEYQGFAGGKKEE